MVKKIFILFLFFLINILYAKNDIKITPTVDRNTISIDETINYTLKMESNSNVSIPNINVNKFPGFTVLNQQKEVVGGSSYAMYINGKLVQSSQSGHVNYHFTLMPKRAGRLKIGPFVMKYNGGNLNIKAIPVFVKKMKKYKNLSDKLFKLSRKNIFMITTVSDTTLYVNQPFYIEYSIFSRIRYVPPKKESIDFSKISGIQKEKVFTSDSVKTVAGKRFNVKTYRVLLFPVAKGNYTIQPQKLRAIVNYDPFFETGNAKYLLTDKIDLLVKKIGKKTPKNFSGIIGDNFSYSYKLSTKKIKQNSAFFLNLQLNGNGNLKILGKMDLTLTDDIELYNYSDSLYINPTTSNLTGTKYYNFVLIPRIAKKIKIKIPDFVYYSVNQKKFITVKGPPIEKNVIADKTKNKNSNNTIYLANNNSVVNLSKTDIYYIFEKKSGISTKLIYKTLFFKMYLGIWILIYIISYIISKVFLKIKTDIGFKRKIIASKKAKKAMKNISKLLKENKYSEIYSELYRILFNFISDKINLTEQGLTSIELKNKLENIKIKKEVISKLIEFLKYLELQRFSPGNYKKEQVEQDINKTVDLFNLINKLKKR